jgi:hypothetical protein
MSALSMRVVVVLCALVVCVWPIVAQDPPTFRTMVRIQVKPDRVAEFRAIQARFTEDAKEAGIGFRGVWRSRNNPYEYMVVTPADKFADYDSARTVSAEIVALRARIQRTFYTREITYRRVLPELQIQPPTTPPMVVVVRVDVHP